MRWAVVLLALAACKSKRDAEPAARPVETVRDGGPAADAGAPPDAGVAWLPADLPLVAPVREVVLPSKPTQPRFDVVGPVTLGDLAIVGSSQLGFAAIDWRRGQLAWTKPTGARLAPPAVHGDDIYLIGECIAPPELPATEQLLGCLRSVTPTGADQAYIAIHGKPQRIDEFSHSAGDQDVWIEGDRARWRRGELAVWIDLVTGVATPAPTTPPRVPVTWRDRHWDVEQLEDGTLVAHGAGKDTWKSDRPFGPLLGAVYLPRQPPMLRGVGFGTRFGNEIRLNDIDALGSQNGAVSMDTVPGIALLAHAISPVGDVALAVRVDTTLKHEVIAGFSANALLRWVWPLPEAIRTDPIGIAIGLDETRAPEAVVVFHDGDTVTILPELSSPPTAPGAVRAPSENATP